jgi:CRP-like cAMP-binding protein
MHEPQSSWATHNFKRYQHLARQGEQPQAIFRVEDGWACRYRTLSAGRRQITALFLPGDYCEPQWLLGENATAPIIALSPLRVRRMPLTELAKSGSGGNDSVTTMLSATLGALRRQSEWIVSLGRKTAIERLCALLSDIYERSRGSGTLRNDQRCDMPLTQAELADVVGLTPVHVNRVLKALRGQGLIELHRKLLRIVDPEQLANIGSGKAAWDPSSPPAAAPQAARPSAEQGEPWRLTGGPTPVACDAASHRYGVFT